MAPWCTYYPGQKNRYSREIHDSGWSTVQSCDIVRYRAATRHRRDAGHCSSRAHVADCSRCRMISHDRTADQSHLNNVQLEVQAHPQQCVWEPLQTNVYTTTITDSRRRKVVWPCMVPSYLSVSSQTRGGGGGGGRGEEGHIHGIWRTRHGSSSLSSAGFFFFSIDTRKDFPCSIDDLIHTTGHLSCLSCRSRVLLLLLMEITSNFVEGRTAQPISVIMSLFNNLRPFCHRCMQNGRQKIWVGIQLTVSSG